MRHWLHAAHWRPTLRQRFFASGVSVRQEFRGIIPPPIVLFLAYAIA
ncbi:hypothetical protein trd_A0434 (plasmid) [Thermomicrobium roseum DSM 5159]|uniref:Uncharacterized protein n=1 Tax=Thermomicrobium roseum (strain ATCC 27502 / DSM 5159 / P-2) TaxID=309801 RepID=B9L3S0_THERP|nr:hypothetical protein trd_A0434 [Thermomicrobium roseum DSM 5159]